MAVMTSVADGASRDGGHLRALHSILDDDLIPAAERGSGLAMPADSTLTAAPMRPTATLP